MPEDTETASVRRFVLGHRRTTSLGLEERIETARVYLRVGDGWTHRQAADEFDNSCPVTHCL
jgi:hypothetical protein